MREGRCNMAGLLGQLIFNGIIMGSLYALLGLSWNIIYGTTGIFHFAHGFVFVVAAYTAVLVGKSSCLSFTLGVVAAVIAAVLVGLAIERGVYRPLRRSGASHIVVFVASLGLLIFGEAIVHVILGPSPRALLGFRIIPLRVGNLCFTTLHVATLVVSVLVISGLWIYLKRTKTGKAIRAVGGNSQMAEALGINRDRIFLLVFAIGSGAAALAGILHALDVSADPYMGLVLVFPAFIVTFIGGVGSIPGVVAGGLLLGLAENVTLAWLQSDYKIIVAFSILLVVLIVRPRGLIPASR
jgi:branched-chain amino acid transport system permease protein